MWFLIMLSDYLKFISEVFPLCVYNYIGNIYIYIPTPSLWINTSLSLYIYIYMYHHIDLYWVANARTYARHTIGMWLICFRTKSRIFPDILEKFYLLWKSFWIMGLFSYNNISKSSCWYIPVWMIKEKYVLKILLSFMAKLSTDQQV